MKKLKDLIGIIEWEALFWTAGLIYLLFINPYAAQHFTFCPLKNAGISFCPGCGLGRSISFLYHFDFIHSVREHPLGLFALILIVARCIQLYYRMFNKFIKSKGVIYG